MKLNTKTGVVGTKVKLTGDVPRLSSETSFLGSFSLGCGCLGAAFTIMGLLSGWRSLAAVGGTLVCVAVLTSVRWLDVTAEKERRS